MALLLQTDLAVDLTMSSVKVSLLLQVSMGSWRR